jgi:phosphoribosylformylglycinamidine cyclo-ligase
MVALTPAEDADRAVALLAEHGVAAWVAGEVVAAQEGAAGAVRMLGEHA